MNDDLGRHLKAFLQSYLRQRDLSPHTIKSYRDAFKLLLRFVHARRPALKLVTIKDLDAKTILAFLQDLEDEAGRANGVRTRNQRLAAVQAFFQYLALHLPALELQARRVLAIPAKKAPSRPADYLTAKELEMLLKQPRLSSADGFRDLALLVFLYNSGARAQEAADLKLSSFDFTHRTVRIVGKGRSERILPLQAETIQLLKLYKEHHRRRAGFTSASGHRIMWRASSDRFVVSRGAKAMLGSTSYRRETARSGSRTEQGRSSSTSAGL